MPNSRAESYIKRAISLLEQAEVELKKTRRWLRFRLERDRSGAKTHERFERIRRYLDKVQDLLDKLESEYKQLPVPPNASLGESSLPYRIADAFFPVLKVDWCLEEVSGLKHRLEEMLNSLNDPNRYNYY